MTPKRREVINLSCFFFFLHYCVLKTFCFFLKFNHFLFKYAFRINCRLRKVFYVLNWIFQYFVLKPEFYWVLHYYELKAAFF